MKRTITRIIHPTDFSAAANNALQAAARLARATGAELLLLHHYDQPFVYSYYLSGMPAAIDPGVEAQWRQDFGAKMEETITQTGLSDLSVTHQLVVNLPVWKFYDEIQTHDTDLVVMGTTGNTGLLHGGLIGTNAERTIRTSPVPVLSIPAGTQLPDKVHNLLFLTDFSTDARAVFLQLWPFVDLWDCTVIVLTVSTPSEFYTDDYTDKHFAALQAEFPFVKFEHLMANAYSVEKALEWALARTQASLVAMFTYGRSSFFSFLQKGSTTEAVSANVNVPLLALKPVKAVLEKA